MTGALVGYPAVEGITVYRAWRTRQAGRRKYLLCEDTCNHVAGELCNRDGLASKVNIPLYLYCFSNSVF